MLCYDYFSKSMEVILDEFFKELCKISCKKSISVFMSVKFLPWKLVISLESMAKARTTHAGGVMVVVDVFIQCAFINQGVVVHVEAFQERKHTPNV